MKKNEWLAEKIGFKISHYQEGQTIGKYPVWDYPDGSYCGPKLPPFESSLDVLERFVWPMLPIELRKQGRAYTGIRRSYYRMSGNEQDVETWAIFEGQTVPWIEKNIENSNSPKCCFDVCCEALGWDKNTSSAGDEQINNALAR